MANNNCITLEDIAQAACPLDRANRGGVVPTLIYGYWEDVQTWPTYPAATGQAAITMTAAGTLTGDLVMATGCKAYKLEFTEYSGTFNITDQGERGGESVLMELTINAGKIKQELLGFMNATRGRRMFFIVTDGNGNSYLMGDKTVAAYRVAGDAATTGAAATDLNQTPMKFQFDALMACTYEGDKEAILTPAA